MSIVPAVISDQVHTGHFKVLQMLVQLLDCATMFLANNIIMQHCSLSLIEFRFIQVRLLIYMFLRELKWLTNSETNSTEIDFYLDFIVRSKIV